MATATPINIDYEDLVSGKDLSELIEKSYGLDGLGILTISNVPGFVEARASLFPLIYKFANMPEEVKSKCENAASSYNVGWSHGKEMVEGGRLDVAKGSFYANPVYDVPTEDQELIAKHPSVFAPNVWPREDLPEFEHAFKAVSKIMVDTGILVSKHIDSFAKKLCPAYEEGKMVRMISTSRVMKARALNYFPNNGQIERPEEKSSWCGWHKDHGSLTGLCVAAYYDENGKEVANPDATCGLYISNRAGEVAKAVIPSNRLAFQIGESSQIHTGGLVLATPHCVQAPVGPETKGVTRVTLACFMEPNCDEPMSPPEGCNPEKVGIAQWKAGQDFLQFCEATYAMYYSDKSY